MLTAERLSHARASSATLSLLVDRWRRPEARRRFRGELRQLPQQGAYAVHDIGLDLAEVVREARKPIWRA